MKPKTYWIASTAICVTAFAIFIVASALMTPAGACIVGMAIGGTLAHVGNILYDLTWPRVPRGTPPHKTGED